MNSRSFETKSVLARKSVHADFKFKFLRAIMQYVTPGDTFMTFPKSQGFVRMA